MDVPKKIVTHPVIIAIRSRGKNIWAPKKNLTLAAIPTHPITSSRKEMDVINLIDMPI
jgi:hypothetical protein